MSRLKKLHIYTSIFAALVVTLICILTKASLYEMSVRVSVAIIIFYVLGQIVRLYLEHKVFFVAEETSDTDAEAQAILDEAEARDAADDAADVLEEPDHADA